MQKFTKSILTELDELLVHKDKNHLIESKALHLIEASINLMKLIKENYSEDDATDLEKRFIGSIKDQDNARFKRGIRKAKKDAN